MTTITTSHTASRTATPNLMSRMTGLVEVAGMLGVAAIIALCINAML